MRSPQDVDVLTIDSPIETDDKPRPSRRVPFLVFASIVVVDQLTKLWAESRLDPASCTLGQDGCINLIGSLRLNLVYNPGAAFSTGPGLGPVFGVLAIAMSAVLLTMVWRSHDRVVAVLLSMIAAGAIGNVADRIFRSEDGILSGKVVDFIDLQWWPVFNIADAAVVVGVLLFIARSLFVVEPTVRPTNASPEPDED